jgi:hypothetical protein
MSRHFAFITHGPRRCRAGLALLASLAAGAPARAQGRGPEDMETLAAYRLTMPAVRRVFGAMREADADPEMRALKERRARDRARPDHTAMTLAQVAADLDGMPPARRALARAGVSAREAATVYAAVMYAVRHLSQEQAAKASGGPPPAAPPGALRESVELVRGNTAELGRLTGRAPAR